MRLPTASSFALSSPSLYPTSGRICVNSDLGPLSHALGGSRWFAMSPSPSTTTASSPNIAPVGQATERRPVLGQAPLIGRERDLSELSGALEDAVAGQGGL